MRKLTLIAMLSLLPALAGCGKPEFKDFSAADGKFTVLMPGTPQRKTQSVSGLNLVMYATEVKNGAYGVGYADLPANADFSLPGAVQGMAGTYSGKVLSEKDYTFEVRNGREFEIEASNPKGFASGRIVVINNRMYEVFVLGTNARLSDPDVQTFLNSFKLTK